MPAAGTVHRFGPDLPTVTVAAGRPVYRIHQRVHGAVWFGPAPGDPPLYRFDAPAGEYRTLYGAAELTGAYVETVLRRARRIVGREFVERRRWTVLEPQRGLVLAKVFDEGLIRHGVTSDICAGDDYAASQRFAADLHAAVDRLDGIAYRARHNNGQICFALCDRIDPADLVERESHDFRDNWPVADEIMEAHGAVWDPGTPVPPL